MKEYIEVINDTFTDYSGKTRHFTMAAISSPLPSTGKELGIENYENNEVVHEVSIFVDDYGTHDYLCNVKKAIRLGICICHPDDTYDEKVGTLKAIARARNNDPVLLSVDLGSINTKMMRAFLEQEAEYLKNNPNKYIKGYNEAEARFKRKRKIENIQNNFSKTENIIFEKLKENPKYLDNVNECLLYFKNQSNGNK